MRPYDAQGRTVDQLFNAEAGKLWPAEGIEIPPDNKIFNFDAKVEDDKTLLILDPYGDCALSKAMRMGFWSTDELTIAIRHETGHIYMVGFDDDEGQLTMTYWRLGHHGTGQPLGHRVPEEYLAEVLENVRYMKRPFEFHIPDEQLILFVERHASYSDLKNDLIVSLHLGHDEGYLELWGPENLIEGSWRKVTKWQ